MGLEASRIDGPTYFSKSGLGRCARSCLSPCSKIYENSLPEELLLIFRIALCFAEQYVSEEELKILEEKTNRQLRLKELLMEYSKDSSLIVM